jgi:integrase
MDSSAVAMIAPSIENCTVRQPRQPNAVLRTREHLTTGEVERLIEIAASNRQGQRDGLMILLAFRHGLRAAEVSRSTSPQPRYMFAASSMARLLRIR